MFLLENALKLSFRLRHMWNPLFRVLKNLVIKTGEQHLCLSLTIFVCCNDGGGGKDAVQWGCRGQEMFFFFLWAFETEECKTSHVECFFFLSALSGF